MILAVNKLKTLDCLTTILVNYCGIGQNKLFTKAVDNCSLQRRWSAKMIHKDIRIRFQIENRRYEAVGFLKKGEKSVSGWTMFRRTAKENGGAIGKKDWAFISKRRTQLPAKLCRYILVTDCHDPDLYQYYFRVLYHIAVWDDDWCVLLPKNPYDKEFLVIRRLP